MKILNGYIYFRNNCEKNNLMSKEIELNITIGKDGKITVEPKGTEGKECLDIMKFLDKIQGFKTLETTPNKDMKKDMKNVDVQGVDVK